MVAVKRQNNEKPQSLLVRTMAPTARTATKLNSMYAQNRSLEMRALRDLLCPLAASLSHVFLHTEQTFHANVNFINNEAHLGLLHDAVGLLLEPSSAPSSCPSWTSCCSC